MEVKNTKIVSASFTENEPISNTVLQSNNINSDNTDGSHILTYTNRERTAESLAPLSANQTLNTIAGLRADDLFANQYFEHESPDNKSATDLAKEFYYNYLLIGLLINIMKLYFII